MPILLRIVYDVLSQLRALTWPNGQCSDMHVLGPLGVCSNLFFDGESCFGGPGIPKSHFNVRNPNERPLSPVGARKWQWLAMAYGNPCMVFLAYFNHMDSRKPVWSHWFLDNFLGEHCHHFCRKNGAMVA
uniref:Uncharacterized protein n=1 Tax=Cannabis sativa TaxID=3483 RepID=A0A803QI04_CANSA